TTVPNFFPHEEVEKWPSWLPTKQVNLGLDLQGGAHLLFEVDADAVIQQRLEAVLDDVRNVLRPRDGSRIGYSRLRIENDAVIFDLTDAADRGRALQAVRGLVSTGGGGIGAPAADLEISAEGRTITVRMTEAAIAERKRHAVAQSIEIVRRRVDELGTREPSIQRQGDDRILV